MDMYRKFPHSLQNQNFSILPLFYPFPFSSQLSLSSFPNPSIITVAPTYFHIEKRKGGWEDKRKRQSQERKDHVRTSKNVIQVKDAKMDKRN